MERAREKEEDEKTKLQKTLQELMNSQFIRRLKHRYPIKISAAAEGLTIHIQLRMDGEPVHAIDISANSQGLVHLEAVVRSVVEAFEIGLEYYPHG